MKDDPENRTRNWCRMCKMGYHERCKRDGCNCDHEGCG